MSKKVFKESITVLKALKATDIELNEIQIYLSTNEGAILEFNIGYDEDGAADFKKNFGNAGISSPFQDGAYIYLVIPGSGSGSSAKAPALIVADVENPAQLHKTLVP